MLQVIRFTKKDIAHIISKMISGEPEAVTVDVGYTAGDNGGVFADAFTDLSRYEVSNMIDMLNEPTKSDRHHYAVIVYNEDAGVPSGTTVYTFANASDARKYMHDSYTNSVKSLRDSDEFDVLDADSDFERSPDYASVSWIAKDVSVSCTFTSTFSVTEISSPDKF